VTTTCTLCDRARTRGTTGDWVLETPFWGVTPHPALPVPGWFSVQTIRHTEGLASLDLDEARSLGRVLSRVSSAIAIAAESTRVYTYSMGERVAHTHILMGPPTHGLRGREFLDLLLRRDQSLVDTPTAERLVGDVTALLARDD
jgi:hypothetical protein